MALLFKDAIIKVCNHLGIADSKAVYTRLMSELITCMQARSTDRTAHMKTCIDQRLEKTRQFNKFRLTLTNSNDDIISSLEGELRNLVLSFFKKVFPEKRCDCCGTKSINVQYERAHNKGRRRPHVALDALKRIRSDESAPVHQATFMRAFIEEHRMHPMWYLCKPCHTWYDRKTDTVRQG